jgi:hypothetical protein
MNDNTVLRIKVPAHLYESVKKQLTLKEAKGKTHYGAGMEVVKEKKLPKKGMEKVEEVGGSPSTNPSDMGIDIVDAPGGIVTKEAKQGRSLEELMKAKEKLEKKINEMENVPKEEIKEYVGMSPDQAELVKTLGELIAGGAASATVIAAYKTLLDFIKGGKKPMDSKGSEEPMGETKEKKEEDK